jgi:hypothetical protein
MVIGRLYSGVIGLCAIRGMRPGASAEVPIAKSSSHDEKGRLLYSSAKQADQK